MLGNLNELEQGLTPCGENEDDSDDSLERDDEDINMGDMQLGIKDERDTAQEEVYDYFDLPEAEQQEKGAGDGYHLLDGDAKDDSDDLEELDDEERQQRQREMLGPLIESIEREER